MPSTRVDVFETQHSADDYPFPEQTTHMHAHDVGGLSWSVEADAGTYVFVVFPAETAGASETLRVDVSYEGVYVTRPDTTSATEK